ncbi:MAG: hypothetical protein KF767_16935 [Bdellovibrionaceae bacterium]|nr:hypothetical protein [Pseudobdellovibrionaceae bacterium]
MRRWFNRWLTYACLIVGLSTLTLFQNCAGTGFQSLDLVSISCDGLNCQESLNAGDGGGRVFTQGDGGGDDIATYEEEESAETEETAYEPTPYTPPTSPSPSTPTPSESLINFVNGGSKAACEQQIADHTGKKISCSLGGGCGISCGKPSGSCASANPQHYGACVSQTDINNAPVATPPAQLFNFVAGGGKAACEKLIADHYGAKGTCSLGGGCGISCGKPGGSCASANPQHYGACYSAADLAALPRAVATVETPKLYNFVAGDKATCEKSIKDRLGLTKTCKVGGGCGISCGKPSGSCVSANPKHYGACIEH